MLKDLVRYSVNYSSKNGIGRPSVSIFLNGCDKVSKCKGCHNKEMQSEPKEKIIFSELKGILVRNIKDFLGFHDTLRVSILGGEPLAPYNINIVREISKFIKNKYSKSEITLYSWRTVEEINSQELRSSLDYIDFGVLGEYKEGLHLENMLPSSSNQYIYDFANNKKIKPIKLKKG